VSRLQLRTADRAIHSHAQRVSRWQRQGHVAHLGSPPATGIYLSFACSNAQGHWRGLLDAGQWLRAQLPQLVELLPAEQHGAAALAMFTNMPAPLELRISDLSNGDYREVALVIGAQLGKQPMACLQCTSGPLWVPAFSASDRDQPPRLSAWVRDIPLSLRSSLGHSDISRAVMAQAAVGDLLIIGTPTYRLLLASHPVGQFTFNSEGLVMNLVTEQLAVETLEDSMLDATPLEDRLGSTSTRVEFVIDERTMTLAQLSEWAGDEVIELAPDAPRQVKVLVNDVQVAIGELVQLDTGLGVQLHTLLRGLPDE
jgi:type III secretion protein Q